MVRNTISAVLAAAAIAIFFFYTKPAYDAEQGFAGQGAQYDAALSKATQLQTVKQSLLSRYNSFDPNAIARLSVMLPDQVDNIRLILDLDNLAGKYGMSLQNVDISAPADAQSGSVAAAITSSAQPWDSLTLQFTTRGTYDEFKQFLASLESSLRLVDLLTLSITPSGSVGGQPTYTYAMALQTYWLR